jgi:AcrR family transcriptional regulator
MAQGTDPEPARRRYRSQLREERAADTRARITRAAGELFSADGFAGTTVARIAGRAGVSEATVYATFGTKGAIVRALLSEMEQQADVAGWSARIAGEPDPRRRLEAFAQWTRALFSSSKATISAVSDALTDPALIELGQEGNRRRREGLRGLVSSLARAGALQPGLSRREAVDRAWMLTGLEIYLAATDGCGWSDDHYERWLGATLAEQLLRSPQRGTAGSD